ncbi:MAG: PAS domain-containing protein, partial [Limisphaerales bacterium]
MYWPVTAIVAVLAAIGIHFWWRSRYASTHETLQREILKELQMLQQAQQRAAHEVQTQQEALFNSMAEGLLLLDRDGHIQLANRAFNKLFGVTADIRSRTIMEALRLHELSELVDFLDTHKQVVDCELKLLPPNERWLQVNGAAIFNADAKRQGAILVFHDLTRLK